MRLLIVLLFGMATSFACRTPPAAATKTAAAEAPRPAARARPQSKKACDQCEGRWGIHGLLQEESCVCKTRDGGKECRDGAECEGQCLGDDARFEVKDPGPPRLGFFVGRCSAYDTTFGCHAFIERGARRRGPVPESERPTALCVD